MSHHILDNETLVTLVHRLRVRRCIDFDEAGSWPKVLFERGDASRMARITKFIDRYTTGRFYMDKKTVSFEDSKDFTIFKLWWKDA